MTTVTKTANGNEAVIFMQKKQKRRQGEYYEKENCRIILHHIQKSFVQGRESRSKVYAFNLQRQTDYTLSIYNGQ